MPEKRRLAEVVEMLQERRTRARIQSQQREAGLVPDDDEEYGSEDSYESTINYSEEDAAYHTSQAPNTRPSFSMPLEQTERSSQLQAKLASFLSQMEQSNAALKTEESKDIEDVDEEKEHIVLELGLGVLEQKKGKKKETDAEAKDESEDDDNVTPTSSAQRDLNAVSMEAQPDLDSSHLDSLLGKETFIKKSAIKEIG